MSYFIEKGFFYLLKNVLIIFKTIFLYIQKLNCFKDLGTECAPYICERVNFSKVRGLTACKVSNNKYFHEVFFKDFA